VYNVFLLSNDPVNQMVAQGGLTQMVHHVFTRCTTSAMHGESADASAALSSQGTETTGSPIRTSFASSRRPSLPPPATPPSNRESHSALEDSEVGVVSVEPGLTSSSDANTQEAEVSPDISIDSVTEHAVNATLYVNHDYPFFPQLIYYGQRKFRGF
jgi:hypothetical protein